MENLISIWQRLVPAALDDPLKLPLHFRLWHYFKMSHAIFKYFINAATTTCVSLPPLSWVLAAAAGELRRDPETFPGQMGHVIPPPPPVCSGSASGLLSVGAVPRKPLEGKHLEPPRPTRSDGNERRFRSELLTQNLRQIRVIFEIFDVKKLANFKGNNSISYCRFKKGESSNKLYIFFSPTDSMTSEQRQKLAKERREERARYIGEKWNQEISH